MTDQELDSLLARQQDIELPDSLRSRTLAEFDRRRPHRARMRLTWKLALAAAVLTAITAGAFTETEMQLDSAQYPLPDGSVLIVRTIARSDLPTALQWMLRRGGHSGMRDGRLERIFTDRFSGMRWGFGLTPRPREDGRYDLIFDRAEEPGVNVAALPAEAAVGLEQPFEFAIPGMRGVYNRLVISRSGREEPPAPAIVADGFVLVDPRVYFDGTDLGSDGVVKLSGMTVFVARKGTGRYTLALDPQGRGGFAAAGEAYGRRIEIRVDGHTWRIECSQPVTNNGPRVVYVYRDAGYQTGGPLEFGAGGIPGRER